METPAQPRAAYLVGRRGRDPRVLVSPPLSSRHVSWRHPIGFRSAQVRDSNCGVAGSRGSALGRPPPPPLRTSHGAPYRGARPVPGHQAGEWRCRGLGEAAGPEVPGPGPSAAYSSVLASARLARPECGGGTRFGPGDRFLNDSQRKAYRVWSSTRVGGCSFVPESLAWFLVSK